MPSLLSHITIDKNQYSMIFETMIDIACLPDYPNVFDACMTFTMHIIKQKGNQLNNIFLFILDPYLEKSISV